MTTDLSTVLSFRNSLRACEACDLRKGCKSPVPWRGDIHPTYAVMGEAPGSEEDKYGQPFVGSSGHQLNHWLKTIGFNSAEMAFLNACQCYPKGTPTAQQVAACRPWMNGQLEFIRPKVLITMGVTAFHAIRQASWPKLQMLHGKPLRHPVLGFTIWPTYHPASYLRGKNKRYEKLIVDDLTALRNWDGHALEVCYVCGDELECWDSDWGIGWCARHGAKQGQLFQEA